jgi:teichuronic acid biosynthesis glycosyltransferase TuaC
MGKLPSGVIKVLAELCAKWPNDDSITVLTNKNHWALPDLKEKLSNRKNIHVTRIPWLLFSERFSLVSQNLITKLSYKLISLIMNPYYILKLVLLINKNNYDGILSHNGGWPAGELNRWIIIAGKICKIKKIVLVIHNTPYNPKYSLKHLMNIRDRFISWCCDEIVTVSESCKKSLLNGTSLCRELRVIYNGLNIIPINKNIITKPPWEKSKISIGFIGELHNRKGVHILIESLQYVTSECEVVLIGNGENNYIHKLEELQTHSKWPVHFIGFRDDIMNIYEWLDIIVLPSIEFESFGMVLLEAMLWSKPTICSDFGGMKEVVEHNNTGFVVPSNNGEALANALDQLLSSKSLRYQMGKAGRNRLEKVFTSDQMISQYTGLFY